MGTFREHLNNWEMSRGCPEGALETRRSGEMVQAEAAAWAQPGGRGGSLETVGQGILLECGHRIVWASLGGGVGAGSGV